MAGILIDDGTGGLRRLEQPVDGCWISLVAPRRDELAMLQELGIPASLLDHASDPDERPRVERHGEALLVVLRHPVERDAAAAGTAPFETAPLSIVVTPRTVVTVAPRACDFVDVLERHAAGAAEISTAQPMRFLLQLVARVAEEFLDCVRRIDRDVERLEDELQRSLRNEEVLGLLRCQKSLTYFRTSIGANELVLERLQALQLQGSLAVDHELLQDVRVEVRQAMAMVDIAADILSQMMDAFASIVSNNLNAVMKVLTSVTIMLAVPTLIVSFYGMNVALPGARHAAAFAVIVLVCVLLGAALLVLFRRRNWL